MPDPAHQPRREEAAGDEAARPGGSEQTKRAVEKPSACPRSGKSRPCRPDAASRKAVPRSSDRIGR